MYRVAHGAHFPFLNCISSKAVPFGVAAPARITQITKMATRARGNIIDPKDARYDVEDKRRRHPENGPTEKILLLHLHRPVAL